MEITDFADKIAVFFENKPVKKAFIFGSAARNEESIHSDVDILVELDYPEGADFFAFLDMQDQLSELLGIPVDLVSSNGMSEFIKPVIDREKRLIYEKKAAIR